MKPAWLGGLPPFNRLLFFVVLMIASFGTFLLAGMLLAQPLFGVSIARLPDVMADFENPSSVAVMKFFQVLQSFGLFIVPPLLAGFFFGRSASSYLALDKSPKVPVYLLVLVLLIVMTPLVNWMVAWNESMHLPQAFAGMEAWMKNTEEEAAKLTDAFLRTGTLGGVLLNLLIIAVLPAIGEEFLFRGVIQRLLHEWTRNIHVAVLISAFAFSAMHLQFYGFLPRFFLGLLFGYLFFWTGSLWIPIFAHFVNNATAVIYEALLDRGRVTDDFGTYGSDSWVLVVLSSVLTILVLYLVFRLYFTQSRKGGAKAQF